MEHRTLALLDELLKNDSGLHARLEAFGRVLMAKTDDPHMREKIAAVLTGRAVNN